MLTSVKGQDKSGDDVKIGGSKDSADVFYRGVDLYSPDMKFAWVDLTATGNIIPLVSGKKFRVYSLTLSASAPLTVQLFSASTQIGGTIHMAADRPICITSVMGLTETAVGEALRAVIAGVGTVGVMATYREI